MPARQVAYTESQFKFVVRLNLDLSSPFSRFHSKFIASKLTEVGKCKQGSNYLLPADDVPDNIITYAC
eukprot:scaffold218873_cov48-Prasinocladus_malaysianus.AAC.1